MKIKRNNFTLIEILASFSILATAVTITMYVLSSSAQRIRRAEQARNNSNRLANVVEFFMLNPQHTQLDKKFFPYEDMQVLVKYEETKLQENFELEINNHKLTTMIIELTDSSGSVVDVIKMDRIVEVYSE
ncbi:type II secretion system protein [Lentisphaerota bacterium WC36G]|nr:type II secretion system GspH family protein [Lentisphaerae bacterium WC36]